MPPTIQTNKQVPDTRDQRQNRTTEKRLELVCKIKYCNSLPDIPFDPKFIQYPFDANRFIKYKPTTLERNYKYEVLTEHDLGVTIDLINKDAYTPEVGAILDLADEKLLEEDILTPQDSLRSRHHARSVSWLRRTEYISTEQTRFQPQNMDKVEAKVGFSIKKGLKEDPLIMDRETQIKAIEKTFEDALKPIEKHYSKPNVYPVEVLPVYPDYECWKYPCAQVIFDSDPAPVGRSVPAQIEEMSQAMIRGVMDESGEQFVAYFLPTEETLVKRRTDVQNNVDYEDDQEYEYKMAREYNWNVKNKASKGYEENYFLVVREGGMYYNELETRVRLSKRRQKPGQAPSNTRLIIKHRPINELEYKMQRYREKQLEPPNEEDEEEEEPEPAPETVTITRTGERPRASDDEEKSGSERGSDNESDKGSKRGSDDDRASRRKSRDEGSRSGSETRRSRSGSRSRSRSRSRSSSAGSKATKTTRRSKSKSKSRSRSRSGSGSDDNRTKKSRSRSSSRSSAGTKRSKTTKASRSRSRSKSKSRSRSKSKSKSRSKSKSKSRSRSRSASGSKSGSGNESGSDNATKKSRSASRSKSRSRSRSGSRSSSANSKASGSTRRSASTRRSVSTRRSLSTRRSRSTRLASQDGTVSGGSSRSNSGSRSGEASD